MKYCMSQSILIINYTQGKGNFTVNNPDSHRVIQLIQVSIPTNRTSGNREPPDRTHSDFRISSVIVLPKPDNLNLSLRIRQRCSKLSDILQNKRPIILDMELQEE